MKIFNKLTYTVLLILFLFHSETKAQLKVGQWQDYFSYSSCDFVDISENILIGANSLGLFYYSLDDNSYKRLNKTNHLHDVGICAMTTLSNGNLIIGYNNGNIDILQDDEATVIPDLKLKNMVESKEFNQFYEYKNKIYCSMPFGIMVIEPAKTEISDTYYIGDQGTNLKTNQVTVYNDTIFASTEKGILKAPANSPALGDYSTWNESTGIKENFSAIIYFNNNLIAAKGEKGKTNDLYIYDNGIWSKFKTVGYFLDFTSSQDIIGIITTKNIQILDKTLNPIDTIKTYNFRDKQDEPLSVSSAMIENMSNDLLIADENFGVVKINSDSYDEYFYPDGPMSNNCFKITSTSKGFYTTAGGIDASWNNLARPGEYSYYDGSGWARFRRDSKDTTDKQNIWRDFLNIAIDPAQPEHAYICSWGTGVFEIDAGKLINNYNQYNSGLQNIDWTGSPYFVRVGGVAVDNGGNVWMNNSGVNYGLILKTKNDKWIQYDYKALSKLHSMGQILIDKNNSFWMIIPRTGLKGLFVFDVNNTVEDMSDDRYRCAVKYSDPRNVGQLKLWDENGEEITNEIYSLAEDKNGYIWVGTGKGVLVYYRPYAIFDEEKPVASRIKVPRNDGSDLADYLLENEKVTAIAVDGGNRKWLGTENSGIFLVSEDGTKTIHSFNVDNSPLVSNNINTIAIQPNTGEVFIGTDEGIVSYKSLATEGQQSYSKIYAYPNPVRENYTGDIIITGLMENSTIKIVDVGGNLVYETKSVGGRAMWNGRNLHGEKVKTGVYVVFVSNEDGSEKATTKILVVN